MSARHTPGPWTLEPVEDRSIRHLCPVDANGISLLTVVTHDETPFASVWSDSDACLIAAAPDLLGALQSLLTAYQTAHGIGDIEMQPAIFFARKCIAAATGETA